MTNKKQPKKRESTAKKAQGDLVFALDIGTRSIIGIVGKVEGDLFKVLAIESEEHSRRSMKDGQIENIDQVAQVARKVKRRLEDKLRVTLKKVCIAAAGRALRTQKASYEIQLEQTQRIDDEIIGRLEVGAVTAAEEAFHKESSAGDEEQDKGFFLVGYSVLSYYLDNFNISSLRDHNGKNLRAEVIATFLPSEVIDSLYMTMQKCGLEVVSLTLEPIAAINAAIPQDLRLLNLALVDIGAGTSDIAVCRDGGITGYTMATVAGDEITEALMKHFLVDFNTAEKIKMLYGEQETVSFTNILGLEETADRETISQVLKEPIDNLSKEIVRQVVDINNGVPSAVFLAGGGSKLAGLKEAVSEKLNMDNRRVAIAGDNFKLTAFSNKYDLKNPEYATPLGIAVSSGLRLLHDSLQILLNGRPAKVFKSGTLKVIDVLMMNGYGYGHILGHSGRSVMVTFEGQKKVFYGERAVPATLKINGKDASISDAVQTDDKVDFIPAASGADAQPEAIDIMPADFDVDQWDIYVNEIKVLPKTVLNNGDVVSIKLRPKSEHPEPSESSDLSEPSELETDQLPVPEGDQISENADPQEKPDLQEEPISQEAPDVPEMQKMTVSQDAPDAQDAPAMPILPGKQDAPVTVKAAEPEEVIIPSGITRLCIMLNGKPLALPLKENKEPYYLMNLLEYSGLDFDNLSSSVSLRVNGEDSNFLYEIKNGDVIEIKCDDEA